jgi:hypothetical protein
VTSRITEIESQIKAMDSELSTMNELLAQAQKVNLAETWQKAG